MVKIKDRLPPGQVLTDRFPVLSLGNSPKIDKNSWKIKIDGLVEKPLLLRWNDLLKFPLSEFKMDIHCVTRWSKFDTKWRGVFLDEIIKEVKPRKDAEFVLVYSSDNYTTNLPIEDVTNKKAMVATEYDGLEIPLNHGGPVRFLVPHLYFWKSAKWISRIRFMGRNKKGYWEEKGYHNYGDPWKEQRHEED